MRPVINRLNELIEDPSCEVGSLIDLHYRHAKFVTNDFRTQLAGGLPERCFLLAVPHQEDFEEIQEVLLLSVIDRTSLRQDSSNTAILEEHAITGSSMDPRTAKTMGNLGYICDVVGTFYRSGDTFRFGGDIERISGNSIFKVYKPKGKALSWIASFSNDSISADAVLDFGYVRFSETQKNPDFDARVFVNIEDFIGQRSAVFGVTRSGKSNTIKMIAKKTFEYAKNKNKPLGQLIFDPQGEYANANRQDANGQQAAALADIGTQEEVRIYKMLNKHEVAEGKIDHLQFNLYDEDNLHILWNIMVQNLMNSMSSTANYIANVETFKPTRKPKNLNSISPSYLEDWLCTKLGVYGLAGVSLGDARPLAQPFDFPVGADLALILSFNDELAESTANPQHIRVEHLEDAKHLLEALVYLGPEENQEYKYSAGEAGKLSKDMFKLITKGRLRIFRDQIIAKNKGSNGVVAAFRRTEPFYNSRAAGDVREKIWADMKAGRLVMVDLSKGDSSTVQVLSEMIIKSLVSKSSDLFTAGEPLVPFQVVVEEAHNLFGDISETNYQDPWVKLAKEGAKYEIGMLYATQEVSSIDERILSNTANFVIAHLNSSRQTNALSSYYRFTDWADSIQNVEAKGFTRMKNKSNPYIVPIQVDLFTAKLDSSPVASLSRSSAKLEPSPIPVVELEDTDLEF